MEVTIHAHEGIEWHRNRLPAFVSGLRALGIKPVISYQRSRVSRAPAILFGTTLWRDIESAPGDWLLVDRASFGDPDYVQLVWNGHGRRGDHCARDDGSRWEAMADRPAMLPEKPSGPYRVICGQCEPYSPHWRTMADWYAKAGGTHFRPHPAGDNPTGLPIKRDFENATAVVLNSSIGVQCIFDGVPTEVHDEGALSYGLWDRYGNDRAAWAHWLAWTQWNWSEIGAGEPIRHLFDRVG